MHAHRQTLFTEQDYLHLESAGRQRHEYVNGEMFAMTGGSLRHNVISLNIATALRAHLRNTPCRTFIAEVRVRVERHNAYYYPDVLVACGQSVQTLTPDLRQVSDPLLIVEVLSPHTEAIDRREKRLAYRTLASLKEYVLVSQDEARVEVYCRSGDSDWDVYEYSGPETVELASVGLTLAMREMYDGVGIEALLRGPE